MNDVGFLLSAMGVSAATSVLLWVWLRPSLRLMLDQLCGRPGSTDFWSRYLLVMLVSAPLVVVVLFAPRYGVLDVDVLRRIFLALLSGHLVAFGLVGRSLFKAVNAGDAPAAAE